MLGRAWSALLRGRNAEFSAPGRTALDLTSRESIERGIDERIEVVVNCAAWTDVDGAESHETAATLLNGRAVGWLAERCKAVKATLLHYSTDYVFDGRARTPYPTGHVLDPINAYGRSKAYGERAILDSGCSHLIVRSSWLYAPWGRNFVRTITERALERSELKVVDDQRGRPSSVEHLAAASLALACAGGRGIFHITDAGECTWYDFAAAIVAHVNPECKVAPCSSSEYPTTAARPRYSVLDLSETEARIGRLNRWQENLRAVLGHFDQWSQAESSDG